MAQSTQHVFTLTNVRTPSSVVSASNVVVTTKDSQDKDIDTTPSLSTDAIVVGALSGALTFDTGTDTPGFLDTATVTFTTAGQVEAGGFIELVMPDLGVGSSLQSGWRYESPVVSFTAPGSSRRLFGAGDAEDAATVMQSSYSADDGRMLAGSSSSSGSFSPGSTKNKHGICKTISSFPSFTTHTKDVWLSSSMKCWTVF